MNTNTPTDADERRRAPAIVCYNVKSVPSHAPEFVEKWRSDLSVVDTIIVPPRDAATFRVPAGSIRRINRLLPPSRHTKIPTTKILLQ